MERLKSIWRWVVLNLAAVSTLAYVIHQGSTNWRATYTFDPGLESGKWAIRFLLVCLAMTPLNAYLGWSHGLKLKKSAGLWAFGFSSVHVLYYLREAPLGWLKIELPLFLALGLLGFAILAALAITSNRWAMRRLGKSWKRLHRLVYLAAGVVVGHGLLAAGMSKKLMLRDPQSSHELQIYLVVLVGLLVVRLAVIRRFVQPFLGQAQRRRTARGRVEAPAIDPRLPEVRPVFSPQIVWLADGPMNVDSPEQIARKATSTDWRGRGSQGEWNVSTQLPWVEIETEATCGGATVHVVADADRPR